MASRDEINFSYILTRCTGEESQAKSLSHRSLKGPLDGTILAYDFRMRLA